MCKINADILQKFLILLILFLFFNASLIKKCKTLKIKIKLLDFVNDINILAYDKFIEETCKTLSKVHNICVKWVHTHDVTFASEKYKLIYFIRKLKKFDMIINIQIESSVIKLKSDVQVLKVQLNMKLWWDVHLRQIEVNHITKMLALSWFEVFTWKTIFTKVRQIYSTVVRSEIAFEALIWHQREKEKKLSNKECRLETLQNQILCHVIKMFKKVSIETLKAEMYISSLHVHLNMLQDKITLCSQVNNHTQKIR